MEKKDFIQHIFSTLAENSIDYFVLGEYQSLPDDTGGSDIDIIISDKGSRKHVVNSIMSLAKASNVILASHFNNTTADFMRFITIGWGVQIDFFFGGLFWDSAPYYDLQFIKKDILNYKGIKVLDISTGYYLNYFKEVVHNSKAKEKYRQAVLMRINANDSCYNEIQSLYGEEALKLIHGNPTLDGLNSIGGQLRSIIRKKLYSRHRWNILQSKLCKVLRLLRKRPGYVITVLGTDGSGKSTVINSITPWLNECFHNGVKYHHLRPNLFPDIAELLGKRKKTCKEDKLKVVCDPHAIKPSGFVGSIFRFLYYLADYTIGYFFKIWTRIHTKSDFVIFDRYYYDYYIDQRRAHLSLPHPILRIGECLVPEPDIILCLGGNPELIFKRKPETTIEEVKRQTEVLHDFCVAHHNAVWINTTCDIQETLTVAKQEILGILSKRF